MQTKHYEVVIIGGGITGAALYYELARYTDIKNMALIEKYEGLATLNTKASSNSQTIHCGDIETNYTLEKSKKIKAIADMIVKYCLMHGYNEKFIFKGQKFAMGVGKEEVEVIKKRYEDIKELYPYLELFSKEDLKELEPKVIFEKDGLERPEDVVALGVRDGKIYTTIDFGELTKSLVENAKKEEKTCDVYFNSEVQDIKKIDDKYYIKSTNGVIVTADFVVVDAGAHSLYLAHKMGYGKNYACVCIAGSYFLTNQKMLNGKVYMVQNPKLPFAALHGDPDMLVNGYTRFGPTALPMPKLERFHGMKSFSECLKTMNFDTNVLKVYWGLLSDSDIRSYVFRNLTFEFPMIKKRQFIKDARKIVPSLQEDEFYYAEGFGGVRPQVIDKENKTLLFGEASINNNNGIIFNMTPSPGATSCFKNAQNNLVDICKYLNKNFDKVKFNAELVD